MDDEAECIADPSEYNERPVLPYHCTLAQHPAQIKLDESGEDALVAMDDLPQSCIRYVDKDSFLVKDGLSKFPFLM
ncbi:hypothetical protein KIN20_033127 [Parelaphostrongylus tenuis]|uniref:Uncharacterized protein n=1 Tax=Parelaphostrongylus tenuis TaxID=148309 RepID=A0AAD5R852_PARTN|nr:hypothetical protein KIN20_033127 [Parelaphostrongylus tenuis]